MAVRPSTSPRPPWPPATSAARVPRLPHLRCTPRRDAFSSGRADGLQPYGVGLQAQALRRHPIFHMGNGFSTKGRRTEALPPALAPFAPKSRTPAAKHQALITKSSQLEETLPLNPALPPVRAGSAGRAPRPAPAPDIPLGGEVQCMLQGHIKERMALGSLQLVDQPTPT